MARQALERNAAERLPFRAGNSENTPSYNADYLAELKNSQPSTPPALTTPEDNALEQLDDTPYALDIASKFGSSSTALLHPSSIPQPSLIPTDAEIREKKERRRRLAAEEKAEDFISLDTPGADRSFHAAASDSDNDEPRHRSLIIPAEQFDPHAPKYPETRLVRDDEDIAEGFDDFVEDSGKVTLSRAGAREQESSRRKDLAAQIRAAQSEAAGGDGSEEDDEVDEEEAARLRAYEAAQTRAGTYGERSTGLRSSEREKEADLHRRLAHAPKVTVVPDFKAVLARWREMVGVKEAEVSAAKARLDAVRREKEEVRGDEARVVVLLEEAGKRFEKLRGEVAAKAIENDAPAGGEAVARGRGLESLSSQVGTPAESPGDYHGDGDGDGEEHNTAPSPHDGGFNELRSTGLGFGAGIASGMAGMAGRRGEGYDSDDY